MITFSVIVPSSARTTLTNTLASFASQLRPGDEVLVDVNNLADWGNTARNRQIERARGDYLLFMDDDDAYCPGAFDRIREAVEAAPGRVHMFRARWPGEFCLWADKEVRCGNVSTQLVAVPRGLKARFGPRYEGDYDFIAAACAELGEPVWHEDVIAVIRPGHVSDFAEFLQSLAR